MKQRTTSDKSPPTVPTLVRVAGALTLMVWAGCTGPAPESEAANETGINPVALLEWNEAVLAAAEEEDGFLTLKGLRTVTMMHVAIWDVLAENDPDLESFVQPTMDETTTLETQGPGTPSLAAHRAAYEVAVASFPDRSEAFEALYARLAGRPLETVAPTAEDRLGSSIARTVLAHRADDGWDGDAEYTWHPMGPGVYAEFDEHSGTPKGFVFGAGWAKARPFVMPSPDHFRAPPPPEIDSDAYTTAFDEVKALGADQSSLRTEDQAHLAMWWKDFAENSHNRLARQLVVEHDLDGIRASLLLARLNVAIYDAYVGVFDNKFHYNHWRPYTAIRWAQHDGNPATVANPEWTNLHDHTYAFPSYPSAHGTACSAAMTVLGNTFGEETQFTMTTATVDRAGPFSGKLNMDPPTRRFRSFREAAEECGLSRLYLGIHFRYDSEEGVELGRRIGRYVLDHTPSLPTSR